jgi:hypothetical protein
VHVLAHAQKVVDFPKEIDLVLSYMIKHDYPEVINGEKFHVRPVSWAIFDVDNDGYTEVFLQMLPYYMQSPAVFVFKILEKDSVIRITEALAPGRLVPVYNKERFVSTHSKGIAADLTIAESIEGNLLTLTNASLKSGLSVIAFKNFIHTEQREGKPFFVDAAHIHYFNKANSCSDLQIALPEKIAAGKIKGRKNNVFIAYSGGEFFCYEIFGFKEHKFIEKKLTITQAPKLFAQFELDGDLIKYRDVMGNIRPLSLK